MSEANEALTATRIRYILARLARTLRREGAATLSASQISALATIEEFGPMRISALAGYESVDPSVATRVVATLEGEGLVERKPDLDDKRASVIDLSDVGRKALNELWSQRTEGLSVRLDRLSAAERKSIEAALVALEKLARDI